MPDEYPANPPISGGETKRDVAQEFGVTPFVADPDFADCVVWHRYVSKRDGYGRINLGVRRGPPRLAHRHVFEECFGALDVDAHLHHVCKNRACVNPAHLRVVAPEEHQKVEASTRTHCRRGHAYSEHGRFHKGTTARYCRACERENERRRDAAVR